MTPRRALAMGRIARVTRRPADRFVKALTDVGHTTMLQSIIIVRETSLDLPGSRIAL